MYTFPATQSSCIRGGSSQEPLGSWEVLPTGPTASPGSPQGSKGSDGGTSDDGASRLVLGQPLWVAFAVLVQVKAAGIDSRAGGEKANAVFYVSGTIRAKENLNSASSTHTQGPAWAPSSPTSDMDCSMPLLPQFLPSRFDLAPEAISFVDIELAAPSQGRENVLL